jgi:hypothetical protein
MGIYADRAFGYLYSISEDGKFKLTDLNTCKIVTDLTVAASGLKYMIHSENRGVFIMGDGEGYIHIYNQNAVSYSYQNHLAISKFLIKYVRSKPQLEPA